MHRAEKSSSRICRNREVERAQELHRKKIDGVKSYLAATISPSTRPTAVKPVMGSMFRRFKAPGAPSQSSLHTNGASLYGGSAAAATTAYNDGGKDSGGEDDDDEDIDTPFYGAQSGGSDSGYGLDALEDAVSQHCGDLMDHSLAKSDEFRSVAPVSKHPQLHHSHLYGKVPPPPAGARKKTLNGSFRTRRLKEIQVDNVGLFERIKKSAAHYRNDDLKREWEQNVSYLSSICEFPLAPVLLANGARSSSNATDATTVKTPVRHLHEQLLPSIHQPVVVHPIRAIPTSPRKLQLNLSPAFRSLRKGMPQQPALPPITASSTAGHASSSSNSNFGALASPSSNYLDDGLGDFGFAGGAESASAAGYKFHSTDQDDAEEKEDGGDASDTLNDSEVASLPCRATCVGSPFIGDLSAPLRANSNLDTPFASSSPCLSLNDEKHKYQLLKFGRFVGGAYLVITVFCGDGVKNPYGFDVFAFDRECGCELKLSVTKEMTHELLDTISSSSQAAVTAAAAGTNLSMEEIAKSICEHVSFTRFESGLGEMAFLMASGVGGSSDVKSKSKSDAALLIDSAPSTIAFCIHQVVEVGGSGGGGCSSSATGATVENAQRKRRVHVFASTRPQKSALMSPKAGYSEGSDSDRSGGDNLTICFQICCDTNTTNTTNTQSTLPSAPAPSESGLEVEIGLDELYGIVSKQLGDPKDAKKRFHKQRRAAPARTSAKDRISIERAVVAAIRHLHIVSVPRTGDDDGADEELQLKQVLIAKQHVNTLFIPVSSSSLVAEASRSRTWLDKKSRSRQRLLPRGSSPTRGHKSSISGSSQSLLGSSVLESGVIYKNAYVLARVAIQSDNADLVVVVENGDDDGSSAPSSNPVALVRKRMPKYIQDLDAGLSISVYNPLSTNYSERKLSSEQINCLVQKLGSLSTNSSVSDANLDFHESIVFLKQVLKRLQIEVDLFGVEVLTFPSLDIKQPLNSHTEQQQQLLHYGGSSFCSSSQSILNGTANTSSSPSRRSPGRQDGWQRDPDDDDDDDDESVDEIEWDAATIIQAHVRGYLFRKQYYEEQDEQDEQVDSVGGSDETEGVSHEEHADSQDEPGEALDVHTEMQFQSDGEYSRQQSRQHGDIAAATANADSEDSHNQQADPSSSDEELFRVGKEPDLSDPVDRVPPQSDPPSPPPNEKTSARRSGTKVGDRYCLVLQLQSAAGDNDDDSVPIKRLLGASELKSRAKSESRLASWTRRCSFRVVSRSDVEALARKTKCEELEALAAVTTAVIVERGQDSEKDEQEQLEGGDQLPSATATLTESNSHKVIAQVNGRVTTRKPDGVCVVAKDSGRIEYQSPRSTAFAAGSTRPASHEDDDLNVTSHNDVYYSDCARGRFELCGHEQNQFAIDFVDSNSATNSNSTGTSPKVSIDLAGVVSDADAAKYEVSPIPAKAVVNDPIEPHLLILNGDGTGREILRPRDIEQYLRPQDAASRKQEVSSSSQTLYSQEQAQTQHRVFFEELQCSSTKGAGVLFNDPKLHTEFEKLMQQPANAAANYLESSHHSYINRVQPPHSQFTIVRKIQQIQPLNDSELLEMHAAIKKWRAWQDAREANKDQYTIVDPRDDDMIAQQAAVQKKVMAACKATRSRKKLEKQKAREMKKKLLLQSAGGRLSVGSGGSGQIGNVAHMEAVQETHLDEKDDEEDNDDSDSGDDFGFSSGDSADGDDLDGEVDDPVEWLWTAFADADATNSGRLSIRQSEETTI